MSRTRENLMIRVTERLQGPRTPRDRVLASDAMLRQAAALRAAGATSESIAKAVALEQKAGGLLRGIPAGDRDKLRAQPATTTTTRASLMNSIIRGAATPKE